MTRRALSSGELQIRFWGVRGSTCASGPQFVEFGSHTPCVEIRCGDRLFIVDAGTGLAALGSHLGNNAPDTVDILFSHLHLDHISGLPFFKPALLSNDRVIRTFCGNLDGQSAEEALETPLFAAAFSHPPRRIAGAFRTSRLPGRRYPVVRGRHQGRNASSQPPGRRHRLPLHPWRAHRLLHQRSSSIPTRGPTRP